MKVDHFESVENANQAYRSRRLLWTSLRDWTAMVDTWQEVVFDEIDVEEITRLSEEYDRKVMTCEARLAGSSAVARLAKLVRDFKSTMPIVTALGNKKLKPYHWTEIKQTLNMEDSNFKLEEK